MNHRFWLPVCLLALFLSACPGQSPQGGGSFGSSVPADYYARCQNPRTGINPITFQPYPDVQGSVLDELWFLRLWTQEGYLWSDEVNYLNPAQFSSPISYFATLKTTQLTPSNRPKDRFHFTLPTLTYESSSQNGTSPGYGITFALLQATPPRQVVVAYTEPNSPASQAGILRGWQVITADGYDVVNDNTGAGVSALNAALFPQTAGESHTLVFQLPNTSTQSVTLTSEAVVSAPVQYVGVIPSTQVGYVAFFEFSAPAENALISAITQLKNQNITDLVLDLRYNGGGFLTIASELAYMIAGPSQTSGKTFEQLQFNAKYPSNINPITGAPNQPIPFISQALGFSATPGLALPHLDFSRVYVLTSVNTCSSSESVINSLRGAGIEVIQIGQTTCGKPYGFYPQDNCGTTYFSIQFRGINNVGFGEYPDGFSPQNSPDAIPNGQATLPGCDMADDFGSALGDPNEAMLSTALYYITNQQCPILQHYKNEALEVRKEGRVVKPLYLQNRIMDTQRILPNKGL